jgi:hypothetical protein
MIAVPCAGRIADEAILRVSITYGRGNIIAA